MGTRTFKKFGAVFGVFVASTFIIGKNPYGLKMTSTESVDHSIFLTKKEKEYNPVRGEFISLLAPNNPESGIKYVKRVVGIPGDEVLVLDRKVFVNGVSRGIAKRKSLTGRDLEPIKSGVIPEGHIYVFAEHIDSYDSRYFEIGFVSINLVKGRAKPLL